MKPPVGKSGPGELRHQVFGGARRVGDKLVQSGRDLREVVRGNVRAHPDGDPGAPVHQQVREACRQDRGLLQAVVEVVLPQDGVLADLVQELGRNRREPCLGVAVCRGRIAVDGAEVALPVDQRIAQRKLLDHAHERVVDGRITVRVVLAQNLPHHGRALLVVAAGLQPQAVHGEEDAAVHRLESVPDVGKRPLYDHAHRVVEERVAHLLLDEAREDAVAHLGYGHSHSGRTRTWRTRHRYRLLEKNISRGRTHGHGRPRETPRRGYIAARMPRGPVHGPRGRPFGQAPGTNPTSTGSTRSPVRIRPVP